MPLLCLLLMCSLVLGGCGFGTGALIASSSGGGTTTTNGQSIASDLIVTRSPQSPAPILFLVSDQESDVADVTLEFRQGEMEFKPITLAAGSAPLTRVPSGPNPYRIEWDYATDLGGNGFHEGIEIRLTVSGGLAPTVVTGVTQGNDEPSVSSLEPTPASAAEYSGDIDVSFSVADSAGDEIRMRVEYSVDEAGGFPAASWLAARPTATPNGEPNPEYAVLNFQSAPGGKIGTFRWDSVADLPGFDGGVMLRFTAEDPFAQSAPVTTSTSFRVDNNLPPQSELEVDPLLFGKKDRGNIPVPFRLYDDESDVLRVAVQWRAAFEQYPELPSTPDDLRDLLDNPLRAKDRFDLHICREDPLVFRGRLGSIVNLAANQVRLPELASSAAALLPMGLAGRTLEILQPSAVQSVSWTPNPLNAPVAALPLADGRTALILDSSGSGWRVRELDLASGAVIKTFAAGAGAPRALSVDRVSQQVFVASSTTMFRFDPFGGARGEVMHDFLSGPRGLAALGSNIALATGDDRLVRFDFAAGLSTVLFSGLAEPWGVAAAQVAEGRVYLAERGANRVLEIEIERLTMRPVPAVVAPGAIAELGAVAFPSPRALAFSNGGGTLLVMTQFGGQGSLRTLELRRVPAIVSAVATVTDPEAGVAIGPDRLRLLSQPVANRLAIGGGVRQRYTIADQASYQPATQVVTLTSDLEPGAATGAEWRIQAPIIGLSAPEGRLHTFVWDTSDVPDPTLVALRVVPVDNDIGTTVTGTAYKAFRPTFDVSESVGAAGGVPSSYGDKLVVADIDLDGDLDVVTARTGSVVVMTQSSVGVFDTSLLPVAGTTNNNTFTVGDLNGDGLLDVVAVLLVPQGNTFGQIYMQEPTGSFAPPLVLSPPPTFTLGFGVTILDEDNDGAADILISGLSQLHLYRQIGSGVFAPPFSLIGFTLAQFQVKAADVDGDGDMDLLTNTSGITSLRMKSGSGYGAPITLFGGNLDYVLADLDGDGDLDLVFANTSANNLTILIQSDPGVFTADPTPLSTGISPFSVVAADLDSDGDLDLVSADTGSGQLSAFYQTAPGKFVAGSIPLAAGIGIRLVAAGDLNGDGAVDLLSFYPDSTIPVLQASSSAFGNASLLPSGQGSRSLVTADLDGDGDLDLVTANEESNNLTLALQRSPGEFLTGATPLAAGDGTRSVTAADLDGDGDLDLVATNVVSNDLSLFLQTAPGEFSVASSIATGNEPYSVTSADVDNDGQLDLIVANRADDTLVTFRQTGPGQFALLATHATGAGPEFVAAADLDRDGDIDLVTANTDGNSLTLLVQTSPGVFASSSLTTGAAPRSVAIADMDGDGALDLVCANSGSDTLTLFRQTGPAVFGSPVSTLATGVGPRSVVTADLDGDGDLDLAVANESDNTVTRWLQTAPWVFASSAKLLATGAGPQCLVAADCDGDGDLDLVTANSFNAPAVPPSPAPPSVNSLSLFFGGK